MKFTQDEIGIAKQTDLCAVASSMGYTVKRVGKYHTLKEMDSIRIYDRTHWYRWSEKKGGSQIDFLKEFGGMGFVEAVEWLLDFVGYRKGKESARIIKTVKRKKPEPEKVFILPEHAGSNAYLYRYLEQERGISREVIDFFVNAGLLYEAKQYHNMIFIGTDVTGTPRFASMRGVFDKDGKGFKCDVAGNDKRYGFNVVRQESIRTVVFEAAIDLMSYMTIYPMRKDNMVALGMLADAPLQTFLKEHPDISEIAFGLDNDSHGREATAELMEKYKADGYLVEDIAPPQEYKDYNKWLVDGICIQEPEICFGRSR